MIPQSVPIQTLLPNLPWAPDLRLSISQVTCDSRQVPPGSLFVAVQGHQHDGHQYVKQAVRQGAVAVMVERKLPDLHVPQLVVESTAGVWSQLCLALAGNPQQHLNIAGITGTNGKSTTAWLLRNILTASGHPTGMLGTIEYSDGQRRYAARLTTPDAALQAELMSSMVAQGTQHCVMEISSHALDQRRCDGLELAAAAVTNITHDHLDYHGSADAYRTSKAKIADLLHCDAPLLLNLDDEGVCQLQQEVSPSVRTISFGSRSSAELRYQILEQTPEIQRLQLCLAQGDAVLQLRLAGEHNASNALAAAGLAEQLGISLSAIITGLEASRVVPGRLERIDEGQPFQVFVDYAHTPDALRRCLQTVRNLTDGKLLCVFGAGGDRDRQKRPAMAQAASAADQVVLTSDNPRSEDPIKIIDDILDGFSSRQHVCVETDRQLAIQRVLELAGPGDSVVIAGKGHEQSQTIGGQTLSFDDRQVAREILRQQRSTAPESQRDAPEHSNRSDLMSHSG